MSFVSTTPTESSEPKRSVALSLLSGMAGTALEAFDYALYGQQAMTLEKLFFSGGGEGFKALAVFAAAFVVRPFGGVFFGALSDKVGRNRALSLTMMLMAVGTGGVGLLPTYAQVGLAAPICLTLLRMLQGFSLGGEYSGAVVYLTEFVGPKRKGLAGALVSCAVGIGVLGGALTGFAINNFLSPEDLQAWGWRIPFLLGGLIGIAGIFLRSRCDETPAFERARSRERLTASPVTELFRFHKMAVLQGIGVFCGQTVAFYFNSIFFLQMFVQYLHVPKEKAFVYSALSLAALTLTGVPGGMLSDRFGRRPFVICVVAVQLLAYLWIFPAFASGDMALASRAWILFGALLGLYYGVTPAVQSELYPVGVRGVGVATGCNIGAALFGGTAPMIGKAFFETEAFLGVGAWAGLSPYAMCGVYAGLAALAGAAAAAFAAPPKTDD